jgi:hypothetical protein
VFSFDIAGALSDAARFCGEGQPPHQPNPMAFSSNMVFMPQKRTYEARFISSEMALCNA